MKKLWFKNKTYGWGWVPVTWQGWTVTCAYILIMILLASTIDEASEPNEVAFMFVIPFIILTVLLIRICYKTGEKPERRRGKKKEK